MREEGLVAFFLTDSGSAAVIRPARILQSEADGEDSFEQMVEEEEST